MKKILVFVVTFLVFFNLNDSDASSQLLRKRIFGSENIENDQKTANKSPKVDIHQFPEAIARLLEEYNLDPNLIWLGIGIIANDNNLKIAIDKYKNDSKYRSFFADISRLKKEKGVIIHHECLNNKLLYEDVLIAAGLGRVSKRELENELKEGLYKSYGYHVFSLQNFCFVEPDREETPEEVEQRHQANQALIAKLLSDAKINPAKTEDRLSYEKSLWKPFFNYFSARKQSIDEGRSSKITRAEIEEIFKNSISRHCTKISIASGEKGYFNPSTFSLALKDSDGRTNLQRLTIGLPPLGYDGISMNLHHLTQHQPGVYVLISEDLHVKESGSLHFLAKRYYRSPDAPDRLEFNSIKSDFFKKMALSVQASN